MAIDTALDLERYAIERRLGQGGMATVFLAYDRRLRRQVAIKLLADNLAGEAEARKRFMREARLAARLSHPNVVQLFDVDEEGGRPYIVMEYVHGSPLAESLGRRRMPVDRAAGLLAQAAAGLAHAHEAGLVHRDVNPSNMLLREDGRLKVVDFGIARAAEETAITRAGAVLGTLPYLAPEQVRGKRATPATDVYALGVVAYELLGGRPPYPARSIEDLAGAQRADPRPLREVHRDIPADLDAVVMRCLSLDARNRYRDADALGGALAEWRDGGGVAETAGRAPAREAPTERLATATQQLRETASRFFNRPPSGRSLAAGAALLAVGAAIWVAAATGGDGLEGQGAAPGEAEAPQARPAVEPAPNAEDPGQQARALAEWLRERGR